MLLKDTRILITHTLISNIMGSTVVCAQIAEALQNMGADVTILTSAYTGPARVMFETRGLNVVVGEGEDFDPFDFDYVWVHSQLLPLGFVRALAEVSRNGVPEGKPLPAFVFNHMSALDIAPDEHPYIPLLEESLASAEVFVSPEAQDALQSEYDADANRDVPQVIVPNPAPESYCHPDKASSHASHLRRIAIVSNHVPDELDKAKTILEADGIVVDIIGESGIVTEVTPELIGRYDAVVTIGKTVQYCMMSATPVFVYDRFGGFGYLNTQNFEACAYANFSGRGGTVMASDDIARCLVEDYAAACDFADSHCAEWRGQYGLSAVLSRLFLDVKPRDSIHFPYETYDMSLMHQMRFAWRYYRAWDYEIWVNGQMRERERQVSDLQHAEAESKRTIEEQRSRMADLRHELDHAYSENQRLQAEAGRIYASHSYRLGHALLKPMHLLERMMQKDA
ncbi:hypothetical protein [Bifidobacterium cuniculi]|uniref:Glycosyl transferase family protein n=1 Tax=Bifidobacterium cuniculi TaxID=1688 RepID=A0A087AZS2_9BIFI|nr:hypothetical protein [Bifidobacterium cuniculi]KFI64272.1 glycosyl transferase family protein [Bifidobacterium cuniculi]